EGDGFSATESRGKGSTSAAPRPHHAQGAGVVFRDVQVATTVKREVLRVIEPGREGGNYAPRCNPADRAACIVGVCTVSDVQVATAVEGQPYGDIEPGREGGNYASGGDFIDVAARLTRDVEVAAAVEGQPGRVRYPGREGGNHAPRSDLADIVAVVVRDV